MKLEKSSKVIWWHKNGDRGQNNFAIPYDVKKNMKPFYIDFIVKFKDGKLGFFDTKSGNTLDHPDTPFKNDGLLKFINTKKNYTGGIITNRSKNATNDHDWRIFNGEGINISNSNHKSWKSLDF